MPKKFSTSLAMIIIALSLLGIANSSALPEVLMWIFLLASIVLNIIGIIGVVTYGFSVEKEK